MSVRLAAAIRDGVVVDVSVHDSDSSVGVLEVLRSQYDEVRVVDVAGIGWTVEDEGLRPPAPFSSWSWDGQAWQAPVPKPDGEFIWDEDAGDWVAADI